MGKAGNFFKSIIPFLLVIVIQLVAAIPMTVVYMIQTMSASGGDMDAFLNALMSITSDQNFTQSINIVYGLIALVVFGVWYGKVFVRPFRHRAKRYPTGFSFHTVAALIFLAFGLQYVCSLIVDIASSIHPAWLANYNDLMRTAGYSDISLLLTVYSVLMAPIVEELVFRGLIFRYARHALPFWAANIWQALLFGIMHMNVLQGIYAFSIGLFLGWVCRTGRGIKYSIVLHILFNILGCFYSGLFTVTTAISYSLFIGLGIVLTIFGMWLFYTDFNWVSDKEDV